MEIVEKARQFVLIKHKNLFRPNKAHQPVVEHLQEVADLAAQAGVPEEGIAAAWLHDTVEDTNVTLSEISGLFGKDVAEIVDGLTDPPEFAGLQLAERKKQQAKRLFQKPNVVKIVKLCDQTSNVKSVLNDPPLDWDSAKCLAYVQGAKTIADICQGLNTDLDRAFSTLYDQAVTKYQEPEATNLSPKRSRNLGQSWDT